MVHLRRRDLKWLVSINDYISNVMYLLRIETRAFSLLVISIIACDTTTLMELVWTQSLHFHNCVCLLLWTQS